MKIRNKNRKIDIQKIYIDKDMYGGSVVSIIVNNQLIEICTRSVYIDDILSKISDYLNTLGDDEYVRL